MNEMTEKLQQDRREMRFYEEDHKRRLQELRDLHAANWETPPLPESPCVKIKKTGEVMMWCQAFADRPDLCENCDENGNTDPAAWGGRKPPTPVVKPPILNTVLEREPDASIPLAKAQEMGIVQDPQQFKTYEEHTNALTLPEQEQPTAVDALVHALFETNFKD